MKTMQRLRSSLMMIHPSLAHMILLLTVLLMISSQHLIGRILTSLNPSTLLDRANGEFKYVPATGLDIKQEVNNIKQTAATIQENRFERCFDAVPEKFRGKETGNMVFGTECGFCRYRFSCWPNIQERPAVMSQAKQPKTVSYVSLAKEYA